MVMKKHAVQKKKKSTSIRRRKNIEKRKDISTSNFRRIPGLYSVSWVRLLSTMLEEQEDSRTSVFCFSESRSSGWSGCSIDGGADVICDIVK